MTTYHLLNWKGKKLKITIDESAKDDFKRMMEWTEDNWESYTEEIKVFCIKCGQRFGIKEPHKCPKNIKRRRNDGKTI